MLVLHAGTPSGLAAIEPNGVRVLGDRELLAIEGGVLSLGAFLITPWLPIVAPVVVGVGVGIALYVWMHRH